MPCSASTPARGENEDIVLYTDESRSVEACRWVGLRQQIKQPAGRFNTALADFVGQQDYAGAFAVTAGLGIAERVAAFEAAHDDYSAIMLKALADRFAEAAAEWLHAQVRTHYWGYAKDEMLDNDALIAEAYAGIRPAPGYPACPDHTAKRELFALLDAPAIGMALTESCAMTPGGGRLWLLHRPPRPPSTSPSRRLAAINWKTGRRARAWTSRKPNAGWRRCCKRGGAMAKRFPAPPQAPPSASAGAATNTARPGTCNAATAPAAPCTPPKCSATTGTPGAIGASSRTRTIHRQRQGR